MAQSGYTPILVYASGTASNVPLAANLTSSASGAELALNYTDGKLYYKNNSGVVTLLASSAANAPVLTFSGGTTGLTPSSATSGAVTLAGTLAVANGGTGVTISTGTGAVVLSTSPTLVTPALGTPTALVGTNITGTATAFNINGTVGATTPAAGSFTTVSATGVSTFAAGTALLPALTTTGDTNTGVWFPASDTIAASTGGTERMRIDSSGNVGIGTIASAASTKFTISGQSEAIRAINDSAYLAFYNTANTVRSGYIQFGAATPATISVEIAQPLVFSTTATERMRIDSSGNVGIGTSSPNNKLQVQAGNYVNVAASISQGSATTGNASQLLLQDSTYILGSLTAYGSAYGSSLTSGVMVSSNSVITTGSAANYSSTNFASKYIQANGTHSWFTAPSGTAGNAITFTQAMTLDASGGLQTLNTIGVGNATPSTSGAGITFPATQSASTDANTLDDYEEGTWAIADLSGAGLGFTIDHAVYTKIGNLVTANAYITFPATASVLTAKISLPFAALKYDAGVLSSNSASLATSCLSIGAGAAVSVRNNVFTALTNVDLSGANILFSISYTV